MEDPDLSLAFYHYLCDIIGTKDVVNTRRQIFTTIDNAKSHKPITHISSGSKAEGLDLKGSDFDLMTLFNGLPVYENKDAVRQIENERPLVMDTFNCKPGYTQLKQHYSCYSLPWCEYKAGYWYLSSSKFRDELTGIENKKGVITHGPCRTYMEGTFDLAKCLRCEDWIFQAQPWILRSNHLSTSNKVIETIVKFGVLFVPVGCKNSPNIDLEWRISFSYAEKLLIWSFNHVQLLCYALLKILLKDIIKQTTGDLLCSYFVKTVMLWIFEETVSSQWKANNITSCFMSCFNRLIYCVQYKTCVHYFIPENDLFAERFDEQQHSLLFSTLNSLKSLGWKCLLQTQTLWSFRYKPVSLPLKFQVSYYPSLYWLTFDPEPCIPQLKQSVYACMRANKKVFYIYMISTINRCISQTLTIGDGRIRGNKKLYNIYRKRLCHLLIGLHHDAVSGWLLLASFFYVNKQYQICMQILGDYMLWCTPEKFLVEQYPSNEEQTKFSRLQRKLDFRQLSVLRKYIASHVEVFSLLSHIFPNEFRQLGDGNGIKITPIVYAVLLKLLCTRVLGNQTDINKCFREMEIWSSSFSLQEETAEILSLIYSLRHNTITN